MYDNRVITKVELIYQQSLTKISAKEIKNTY